jgi:signal transduction histidine kinase
MGEMIGNIAHQWRQPINALALLLMNLKDAQQFGEMTDQYLASQIERGDQLIRKMSTTIDDFRNFFRPHRDKQAFLLSAAVRDALSIIESAYEQHRIEIEVSIREDAAVLGFRNEYTQVLLNLLSNAKEAIEARKVARGRVQIVIDCDGREARLTVRDNGGGIPPDVLPKIFDPYFTTRDGGTGIGLYMSKMIIESSMKGGIEARNTTDGAEFSVLTPVMRGAAAAMDTGLADA